MIFEFTIFNLVIRLSKVQQLALFRFHPVDCRRFEQLAAVWLHSFFSDLQDVSSLKLRQQLSFVGDAQETDFMSFMLHVMKAKDMPLGVCGSPFS